MEMKRVEMIKEMACNSRKKEKSQNFDSLPQCESFTNLMMSVSAKLICQ